MRIILLILALIVLLLTLKKASPVEIKPTQNLDIGTNMPAPIPCPTPVKSLDKEKI